MYKMLVVALFTACAVNIACLCGHLRAAGKPQPGSSVMQSEISINRMEHGAGFRDGACSGRPAAYGNG